MTKSTTTSDEFLQLKPRLLFRHVTTALSIRNESFTWIPVKNVLESVISFRGNSICNVFEVSGTFWTFDL